MCKFSKKNLFCCKVWRGRRLSRTALCYQAEILRCSHKPNDTSHHEELTLKQIFCCQYHFLPLQRYGNFNLILNKALLDISCHSVDVSREFQPIKITLSGSRYFYSNFRCRPFTAQTSTQLIHRSPGNSGGRQFLPDLFFIFEIGTKV